MAIIVSRIKGPSGSWQDLPTPIELTPVVNVVDGPSSGRDNNTAYMYRDIVGEKTKYTCVLPYGLSNTQVATIAQILLGPYFYMFVPDIKTGTYTAEKKFYCTEFSAPINKDPRNNTTTWYYEEITFNATEL